MEEFAGRARGGSDKLDDFSHYAKVASDERINLLGSVWAAVVRSSTSRLLLSLTDLYTGKVQC